MYQELSALDDEVHRALRDEYRRLADRLAEHRTRIAGLTKLVAALEQQAAEEGRLIREVARLLGVTPELSLEELDPRLSGQRLVDVATELLRLHHDVTEPVHYRDWFEMVRRGGYQVAGKDPLANFLAHVNRAEQVEAVGRRTGLYRLRTAAA